MNRTILRCIFLVSVCHWFAGSVSAQSEVTDFRAATSRFVDLYNKKDLTGWSTKGNWIPQKDGSLVLQPREGEFGWQRYDAYLWTERKFKDFELKVEFAYPKNGNSGVYFRVADRNNPVYTGIEAQVFDSSKHQGPTNDHTVGGIIPAGIAPSKNMANGFAGFCFCMALWWLGTIHYYFLYLFL